MLVMLNKWCLALHSPSRQTYCNMQRLFFVGRNRAGSPAKPPLHNDRLRPCSFNFEGKHDKTTSMSDLHFMKMHGLGNDFMVVDFRGLPCSISSQSVIGLSNRRRGVGFDQLAELRDSENCDAKLVFFNADGSRSGACGNATRCVARLLFEESGKTTVTIETDRGSLACIDAGDGLTGVNMGMPRFDWQDIPLAEEADTRSLPIEGAPTALSMGNPHCVFIVPNVVEVEIDELGPKLERHPMFPERTNVEFVSILSRQAIRLRIWERGAGVTPASGSGSSAAAVAAARLGLVDRHIAVHLDGGKLDVDWRDDGVWMTGPTAHVFNGSLDSRMLEGMN